MSISNSSFASDQVADLPIYGFCLIGLLFLSLVGPHLVAFSFLRRSRIEPVSGKEEGC